jgi:2,4-dienoyl-CoA reductase-like NADH-dependent reductase (Old Yellow Enzyme family)
MNYDKFFLPFTYKSLKLRNRFVMAPMTRVHSPDGIPTQEVTAYYGRRAAADVGLILTEGTVIDRPSARNHKDVPNFYGNEALQVWQDVANTVHQHGGSIAPQIWHVGNSPYGWEPPVHFESPATMTRKDIDDVIAAFTKAAIDAKRLGFDAIEIHGAHGYLIDQFFWAQTNTREDEYGGETVRERTRFGVDVVKAIRAAVGNELTIIMRLSQWKSADFEAKIANTPKEVEDWVLPLAEAGVDIFHASTRRYWQPEFEGSDLNLAGWFKKVTGQPTITVGSVGLQTDVTGLFSGGKGAELASFEELLRRYERGDFDLIAVGRQLLQDPEWVSKIKNGRLAEIKSFNAVSVSKYY